LVELYCKIFDFSIVAFFTLSLALFFLRLMQSYQYLVNNKINLKMKLKIKKLDFEASTELCFLNTEDAKKIGITFHDRLQLNNVSKKKELVCVVDISNSITKEGEIGLCETTIKKLSSRTGYYLDVIQNDSPKSIHYIKDKLNSKELSKEQINTIVSEIVDNSLSDVEKTYFVCASYINGLSHNEIVNLTKAIASQGETLKLKGNVVDKHCAGGVPGNRTTMLVVPILVAAGFTVPKTSSRSITSPSGTADTMEVLCDVEFSSKEMKKIISDVGGCIVWGGGINLAPADDKLIKIRHPLSLDPIGMLLASILAKKYAVSSKFVLIDLPVGENAKMNLEEAKELSQKFISIGKDLGMTVDVIITDGDEPIGMGIGPSLEAKDVLKVLRQDKDRALDLEEKAIDMAAIIMEKNNISDSRKKAKEILTSKKAYDVMKKILAAQNGKIFEPEQIRFGKYKFEVLSKKQGKIKSINNVFISDLCRLLGAPNDKYAGINLYKHKNDSLKKKEKLFTMYSDSEVRLKQAKAFIKKELDKNVIIK
jgi:AMP phosphorylase